jgi:hypothetical protein
MKKEGILGDVLFIKEERPKFDKWGIKISPKFESYKAKMLNPRRDLHQKGAISYGEQYVFDRLEAIGQIYNHKLNFEVDSLLESAMDSQKSADKISVLAPQVSLVSDEDIILCNPDPKDDASMKLD